MGFYEIVSAIVSVISFFALIGNVLQYTKKREMAKDLFQMVLTQYNNYYLIARALTRIRNMDESNIKDMSQLKKVYDDDINFVKGVADSARLQLMNFSKNQLDKDVFYQHPAFPEKTAFSDEVKMGLPPEKEDSSHKIEIAKRILMNKNYLIQMQEKKSSDKGHVTHYTVLNEDYGGIPGSNIGIADYANTNYLTPGVHEDQEFFYVIEGVGKAKIGECEINIAKDSMFVVPPNTEHTIMSSDSNNPVRVLWVHNPIDLSSLHG